MQSKVIAFNNAQREEMVRFRAGDVVKVHRKIIEGSKERIQIFEGMVIAMKGGQSSSPTMTVRKVSMGGYGVEIIVPIFSPVIEKIELVKRAKVRRSKLYYIRDKAAKALRFKFTDARDVLPQEESTPKESVSEKVSAEGGTDDLTKIEGIGPVIAKTLNDAGITTFAMLATAKDEDTQKMIDGVSGNHQADTWNEQALLAQEGKWDDLKDLQERLVGGVEK